MTSQNTPILEFKGIRSTRPSPVAAIRVQVSESFLDTAERVAAYLQGEQGAVSAALNEHLSAIPLYEDVDGNLHPEDSEGNVLDPDLVSWPKCRASVNRDGSVEIEMGVSHWHFDEVRQVRVKCNLGTVDDLRVRLRESDERTRLQNQPKPRMGM